MVQPSKFGNHHAVRITAHRSWLAGLPVRVAKFLAVGPPRVHVFLCQIGATGPVRGVPIICGNHTETITKLNSVFVFRSLSVSLPTVLVHQAIGLVGFVRRIDAGQLSAQGAAAMMRLEPAGLLVDQVQFRVDAAAVDYGQDEYTHNLDGTHVMANDRVDRSIGLF